MGSELLPIGRRVAYWRSRRNLSQQVFADRLGRSKSWVEKVERGVRSLERISTIQDIATVLRVDTAVLLGRDVRPGDVAGRIQGVDRIRAALSTYEVALGGSSPHRPVPSVDQLARSVAHAWTTYQHARYPQLVDLVPELLIGVQRYYADQQEGGRSLLVEAYRVTTALLVKLGETESAWLAADRAMTTATGSEPELVAAAVVQLGQVLRASGRSRSARSATLAAAYRIIPTEPKTGSPERVSLVGTLLIQAALAAARIEDRRAATDLIERADALAAEVGDGHDHYRAAFGPTTVRLARVALAVELGDGPDAIACHEQTVGSDGWRWLPVEHRAAHLIDAARAYLQADIPINASRVLTDAYRIAPAEIRLRPTARNVLAQVAHHSDAPEAITRLAATLHVTRP